MHDFLLALFIQTGDYGLELPVYHRQPPRLTPGEPLRLMRAILFIYTPTSESRALRKVNALTMISFSLSLQSRRISWISFPAVEWE